MILLCNGDSWTGGDNPSQEYSWKSTKNLDWYDVVPNFGDDTNPCNDKIRYKFYNSNVWPKVLGKELGWETWNCGRLGASNDRIIRTTINSVEYLESLGKKDLFVVLGLTSLTRFSRVIDKHNKLVFNDIHMYSDFMENINNLDSIYYHHLVNIINLQNYLKMKNIPYQKR